MITNRSKLSKKTPDWTRNFIDYLLHVIYLDDSTEARRRKIKAPQFAIRNTQFHKRGYFGTWLKYVIDSEGQSILRESHAGEAGVDEGARTLTRIILHLGVY